MNQVVKEQFFWVYFQTVLLFKRRLSCGSCVPVVWLSRALLIDLFCHVRLYYMVCHTESFFCSFPSHGISIRFTACSVVWQKSGDIIIGCGVTFLWLWSFFASSPLQRLDQNGRTNVNNIQRARGNSTVLTCKESSSEHLKRLSSCLSISRRMRTPSRTYSRALIFSCGITLRSKNLSSVKTNSLLQIQRIRWVSRGSWLRSLTKPLYTGGSDKDVHAVISSSQSNHSASPSMAKF